MRQGIAVVFAGGGEAVFPQQQPLPSGPFAGPAALVFKTTGSQLGQKRLRQDRNMRRKKKRAGQTALAEPELLEQLRAASGPGPELAGTESHWEDGPDNLTDEEEAEEAEARADEEPVLPVGEPVDETHGADDALGL